MNPWWHDTTIDGRAARLFLLEPNWRLRPKIALTLETEEAEGGTGREARAPQRTVPLLTQTLFFTLPEDAAEELLSQLQTLSSERIAVPLWPDARAAADHAAGTRIFTAQHTVNLDPVSGAYVVDGSGGHPLTAGLLVGRLAAEPDIIARTDLDATVELRIEEDSPWDSRILVNTLAAETWTWLPNWRAAPQMRRHTQFERRRLGRGREQAFLRAEAPVKREDRALFTLEGVDEIRRFLSWWVARLGPVEAFEVPSWFHPGDTDPEDTWRLVRFAAETLVVEFIGFDAVRCNVDFRAVRVPGGGEPDEVRAPRATLVKVWWEGAATAFAWSDWESPLTHDSVNYTPAIVEVERSVETLRPGETEWQLLVCDFDGNPLRAFALLQLERRLKIEIRECDPANAAAAALVFAGEIKTASRTGEIYRAKCALFGGALRHLVPNYYCQPGCNHTLYDDLCGIDPAAHKVTGAVTAVGGTVIDVTGGGDKAADWFAYGYALIGAGDTRELRSILRSEPIVGGTRLTLHRPLFAHGVTAAVDFFPGCDGQYEGGCAKFANQDVYGGFPWKPEYIESVETGFKTKTGK